MTNTSNLTTDAFLDRLGLRVNSAVVHSRLQAFSKRTAKGYVRAAAVIAVVFSLLAGPLIWLDSGIRLASIVVGCLLLIIPIAALVANRDANRTTARWMNLPWKEAISFLTDRYGLVMMSTNLFALELTGQIWSPPAIKSVQFQADTHSIKVTVHVLGDARLAPGKKSYTLPLPRDVYEGQAQVIADFFHQCWTGQQRIPSDAARAWLKETMPEIAELNAQV